MISLEQLVSTLNTGGETYAVLNAGSAQILITQRGGRIFGPFLSKDAPALTWINPALAAPHTFAAFIANKEWNLGGNRIWIAPEIQYIIHDRFDFWGTHRLPAAIDPGQYILTVDRESVHLAQRITLKAYNIAAGEKTLDVTRRIYTHVVNPLRALNHASVFDEVTFIGYAQEVTLTDMGGAPMASEAWDLVQLNPGGQLIIPVTGEVEVSPYFGSPTDDSLTPRANPPHLRIAITGDRQYKVGYKAAYLTGRFGYYQTLSDGRACLMIRHYDNNPSAHYSEEPPQNPGVNGHSIHVYNDDGGMGGFGEMECSGQAIGGPDGRTTHTDTFTMWCYVGTPDLVNAIGRILLGAAP